MLNNYKLRNMRKQGIFNNNDHFEYARPSTIKKIGLIWLWMAFVGLVVALMIITQGCAYSQELRCIDKDCSGFTYGIKIDIVKIAQIESSNNPKAFNKRSKATGLCQITPIVLKDYNKFTGSRWAMKDLFNMDLNLLVCDWYINLEIPRLLRAYGLQDNERNRLWAYNAGIRRVKQNIMPIETKNYIIKYDNLDGGK